ANRVRDPRAVVGLCVRLRWLGSTGLYPPAADDRARAQVRDGEASGGDPDSTDRVQDVCSRGTGKGRPEGRTGDPRVHATAHGVRRPFAVPVSGWSPMLAWSTARARGAPLPVASGTRA